MADRRAEPLLVEEHGRGVELHVGASSPGRLRKKPPASPRLEVSGPRPSFCSRAAFSGVAAPRSDSASVRKLSSVM